MERIGGVISSEIVEYLLNQRIVITRLIGSFTKNTVGIFNKSSDLSRTYSIGIFGSETKLNE